MRLKLARADFTYSILLHQQALQVIAMLGLKDVDVELFEDRSHLQPSSEFKNVRGSARKLRKKLEDNGLVAADLFLQLALDYQSRSINNSSTAIRNRAREAFRQVLDYAAECKGRHVTILPGAFFNGVGAREATALSADEIAWRVERARAYKITLAFEPHKSSLANTPTRAKKLVEAVRGLTLTLDYCYFVPRGFAAAEVHPLIQHTSHFHARGTSCKSGSTSLADNTLDWKKIFKTMDQTNYKDWIKLEFGSDNITDTVQFHDYFRSLFN